jgi:uncharacterized protein DUF2690
MRILRSLAVCVALASIALIVTPASPAHAASCWGDWCSGLDPQASGCSADAKTVASANVPGLTGETVELRWSPTCKTNWTRTNFSNFEWLRAIQPSTGYTQGYSTNNDQFWWSKQIYSPTRCVYGSVMVTLPPLGRWGETQTACV